MTRKKNATVSALLSQIGATNARKPTFVEIAQPKYVWEEIEAPGRTVGYTMLPNSKKDCTAAYVAPTIYDNEESRLIRLHELLHARYTPSVHPAVKRAHAKKFSAVSINYAEDHRLYVIGQRLDLFKKMNASIDRHSAADFVGALADQGGIRGGITGYYVRGITTGKIVQASVGLLGYPCAGFDPASACEIATLGAESHQTLPLSHERPDLGRAQEIIDLFRTELAEIHARPRTGRQIDRKIFAELLVLVEKTLAEAYREETKEPPSAQDDLFSAAGDNAGDEPLAGEIEPAKDAGENAGPPKRLTAKQRAAQEQDAEDKEIDDILDSSPASRLTDVRQDRVATRGAVNTLDGETPEKALAARAQAKGIAAQKEIEQQRRDLLEELEKNNVKLVEHAVGCGQQGGTIEPPVTTLDSDEYITLSLLRSEWAPMQIQFAPLSRAKRNLAPRLGRAGIEGSTPKHLSRWFSDRSIMDTKGRRPGGALLVDVSGSMNWTAAMTQKLVDDCPALTVALYSSQRSLQHGLLTIVARNGRVIADGFQYKTASFAHKTIGGALLPSVPVPGLIEHGTGNVCDGPALLWLAKQPGPRLWWCDGNVSGAKDSFSLNLTIEAFRLAYLAQVTRTTDMDTVKAVLSGLAKPSPVPASVFLRLLGVRAGHGSIRDNDVIQIVRSTNYNKAQSELG